MIFTLVLALAFAVVAVIFALANPMMVAVSFFGYSVEGSLALFILLAVGVGIVIGVLVMLPGTVKRSLALSSQRKKLKGLEKKLDEHKAKVTELEEKEKANKPVVEDELPDDPMLKL
ncbi:MAG: LapA family protein [Chloroflexi bacterium]|nr:LapA family protein [Chloroflexota bacterium]